MSLGLERLFHVFNHFNHDLPDTFGLDFYIMPMDAKFVGDCAVLMNQLRYAGMMTDMSFEAKSFKSQFKAATKKKAKFAIIIGEDEWKNGEFTVKNLTSQIQTKVRGEEIVNSLRTMLQEYYEQIELKYFEEHGNE